METRERLEDFFGLCEKALRLTMNSQIRQLIISQLSAKDRVRMMADMRAALEGGHPVPVAEHGDPTRSAFDRAA